MLQCIATNLTTGVSTPVFYLGMGMKKAPRRIANLTRLYDRTFQETINIMGRLWGISILRVELFPAKKWFSQFELIFFEVAYTHSMYRNPFRF